MFITSFFKFFFYNGSVLFTFLEPFLILTYFSKNTVINWNQKVNMEMLLPPPLVHLFMTWTRIYKQNPVHHCWTSHQPMTHLLRSSPPPRPTKQSQTGVKRLRATYCSGFRNVRCFLGQTLHAVCIMKHQLYSFFLWFQLLSRIACNLFRRVTSKLLPISYTSVCMSLSIFC